MASSAPTYPPDKLIAATGEPLRSVARRLGVDPAVLCRPLTTNQADRFAVKLGMHPGLVWGADWWRPGKGRSDAEPATFEPDDTLAVRWAKEQIAAGRLSRIREDHGYLISQTAHMLGCHIETIQRFESGRPLRSQYEADVMHRYAYMLHFWHHFEVKDGQLGIYIRERWGRRKEGQRGPAVQKDCAIIQL